MKKVPDPTKDKIIETVCVFVASSDNTRDIFYQVAPSFGKHWSDCPFSIFVGLNSPADDLPPAFQGVYAPARQWQKELSHQLNQLPEQIERVLLFLDDFLILSLVDTPRVLCLVEKAVRNHIRYLRLIPQSQACLPLLGSKIRHRYHPVPYEAIRENAPYNASLQIALWERKYLANMLGRAEDIWDFEHVCVPGIRHFSVVENPPIRYVHVVEKGQWEPNAESLFKVSDLPFDPTGRKIRSSRDLVQLRINKMKFAVLGYSVFRLKRWIKKLKK